MQLYDVEMSFSDEGGFDGLLIDGERVTPEINIQWAPYHYCWLIRMTVLINGEGWHGLDYSDNLVLSNKFYERLTGRLSDSINRHCDCDKLRAGEVCLK